jgi:hypothetical protein
MRKPTRLAIALAFAWAAVAYLAPPIGMLAAVICLFCAIIQMGMNGAGHAEYAPVNVAAAVLAFAAASIGLPP